MRRISVKFDPQIRSTFKYLSLSILIGILGAVAAQAFHLLIEWGEEFLLLRIGGYQPPLEDGTPEEVGLAGLAFVPIVTTLGGLLSGLLVYGFAKEAAGGGEDAVIHSFHRQGGSVRKRIPVIKALSAAITTGSGGASGREGPMAQISAGIGCMVARLFRLPVAERRSLVIAGTAAGISAMFHSPLGAAFLAVEILYHKLEIEVDALVYSIVASAVAYATMGFFTDWRPLFTILEPLTLHHVRDLWWYALLGLAAGALSIVIPVVYNRTVLFFEKLPVSNYLKPALGGMIVGLIALVLPQVLGAGYGWIQLAIEGRLAVATLLTIGLVKILAFSMTTASGGSGGVFAPVLFTGAMFGSALALGLESIVDSPPNVAAMTIAGMAAFYAGVSRAPIGSIIIATELTGGYGLIAPIMLAVSLAFLFQPLFSQYFESAKIPLYRSQVGDRFDSPTHQQEFLQVALDLVQTNAPALSGPVSLPDIDRLLSLGQPIPVGSKGEYIYRVKVPEGSAFENLPVRDLPFVDDVLIATIFRDGAEEVITPRGSTVLTVGDILIVICHPEGLKQLATGLEIMTGERAD